MPNSADTTGAAGRLIEFARANLNFAKILEANSRGGEFTLLFMKSAERSVDIPFVWINAWIATEEHIQEIERSSEHLQGRYIQRGFHPGYGIGGNKRFYEPIYGGPVEPLALGWSADSKRVEPEISQELERCYKLTRTSDTHRIVWNSWQESMDGVAILEKNAQDSFALTIRDDFLRDFQFLRNRWLLIGVYGEWGKRTADEPHIWAVDHKAFNHKLYLFGVSDGSSFKYVEAQGYILAPIPKEEGFSATFGLAIPAGLRATVENIEFQTSAGRIRPWEVREGNRHDGKASATAVFDQEVIRRYQSEPGAQVSLDGFGQLQITSRKVRLYRLAMLLGTEYMCIWLSDFVEGVPPSEWPHWYSHNVPFIGFEKRNELFEADNLFRMTDRLNRAPTLVNNRWLSLTSGFHIPFNANHHTEKDSGSLMKALPRQADAHELIDRAKALDGLLVERIATDQIKTFLRNAAYPAKRLKDIGSIKLFSTLMMVLRIAEATSGWMDNIESSLSYAVEKVSRWQDGMSQDLTADESKVIENLVEKFQVVFLIHGLRRVASHPITPQLTEMISLLFKKYIGSGLESDLYRGAILDLYHSSLKCLQECRR
jgi:hypothetical protein